MPLKSFAIFAFFLAIGLGNSHPPESKIFHGSTVVCIAGPNVIYIGADSKLGSINGDFNEMMEAGLNCKVHQKDKIIYGSVGIFSSTNPNIDGIRIINRLDLSKCATLKEKIAKIEKSICDSMVLIAEAVKKTAPNFSILKCWAKICNLWIWNV